MSIGRVWILPFRYLFAEFIVLTSTSLSIFLRVGVCSGEMFCVLCVFYRSGSLSRVDLSVFLIIWMTIL